MDYKQENCRAYDEFADAWEKKFRDHFDRNVCPRAERFAECVKGGRVLDLGSGPGDHALFFKERGLDVLCVDLSEEMVKRCVSKGLEARKMDIEALDLPPRSFDAIWAYASILHVPKDRVAPVVSRLASLLKGGGLLAVGLKEGEGEEWRTNPEKYPGTMRFFSYFSDAEVRSLFEPYFDLLEFHPTDRAANNPFLFYVFRLKVDVC